MTTLPASTLVSVTADPPVPPAQAAILATTLHLPLVAAPDQAATPYLLVLTPDRLELRELGPGAPGPVYVDFVSGAVAHRRLFGGGRGQPLARAVGLKGGATPTVIDATAGLGRDAFVLACLGCTVQLVERSPVIAALLHDGLQRAAQDPTLGPLVTARLRLQVADAQDYLRTQDPSQRPDVVYLDPMYPHRRKSALVGKEMRLLRHLVGDDQDAAELLRAALGSARQRVVVKRPRLAPSLNGPPPSLTITAPNTRFDVYLTPSR